jgi:hypothetical protein
MERVHSREWIVDSARREWAVAWSAGNCPSRITHLNPPHPPPLGHSVAFGVVEEAGEMERPGVQVGRLPEWHEKIYTKSHLSPAKFQLLQAEFQLLRDIWGTFWT